MAEEPRETPRDGAEASRFERWIGPFFRDASLWPVLAVATAIFVTLGTAVVLLAAVDRNLFAVGALFVLGLVSFDVAWRDRRGGRFGLASRCLLGYWILVAACAFAVARTGWFQPGG